MENTINKQVKDLTDKLEKGIKDLFESNRYKEYLKTMSKFHNYSFNNVLLIAMQKPDASLIAGYNAWKNIHHRQVIKGEKAIKILAPAPYIIKITQDKVDPVTQKKIFDKNGKPIQEEVEIKKLAFKIVNVFDVSQTEGKEIPIIGVSELQGNVKQYQTFFDAVKKVSPVPVDFEQISTGAKGYYHLNDKRIAINEGMSELHNIKTLIHEITHAKLHDIDLNAPKDQINRPDQKTIEVQAESVAYVVCQHYGLDTSDYSFAYVAKWSSSQQLGELKESLDTIRITASGMIKEIDKNMEELQKNQIKENKESDKSKSNIEETSILVKLHQKQENINKNSTLKKTVPAKEAER